MSLFDPNSSQTNALLNIHDNRFNLFLQQVYYSEKCSRFYIGLLVLSFGLIMVTIFDGFQVADSPLFIVLEFILNLLIGIDFACRIKLVGCAKYVRDPNSGRIRCWNIFGLTRGNDDTFICRSSGIEEEGMRTDQIEPLRGLSAMPSLVRPNTHTLPRSH